MVRVSYNPERFVEMTFSGFEATTVSSKIEDSPCSPPIPLLLTEIRLTPNVIRMFYQVGTRNQESFRRPHVFEVNKNKDTVHHDGKLPGFPVMDDRDQFFAKLQTLNGFDKYTLRKRLS
jgi:hypothetical protein